MKAVKNEYSNCKIKAGEVSEEWTGQAMASQRQVYNWTENRRDRQGRREYGKRAGEGT